MTNIQLISNNNTFIDENTPNTNCGGQTTVTVGLTNKEDRTLIGFDLSSIPPTAIISDARLKMTQESTTGQDSCKINRITEAWDELIVTWNNQPAISDLINTFTSGLGNLDIDVITAVQNWVNGTWANSGMRLMSNDLPGGHGSVYWSRYNSTDKPYLDITYTVPPPAPAKFRAKIYLIGYIPSFLFVAFLKKEIKIIWQTLLGSLQGKKPSRSWQPAQT